ncbi:MAG: DUF4367 domain-containing protein [Clostridia bacterium]|nr:DUF4367 domain-containing protein [Clostridia bacterium]
MSKNKINEAVFDTVLAQAFMDEFEQEMDELEKEPLEHKELPEKYRTIERRYYNRLYGNKTKKYLYLRRAVACILICMSIGFVCLMAAPNVRATLWESMVTFYEKYLKIDFGADNGEQIGEFYAGYIPDGFTQTDVYESTQINTYQFEKGSLIFTINYIYSDDKTLKFDGEQGTPYPIRINDHEAYRIEYNNQTNSVVWRLGNYVFVVEGNIFLEELVKIAENLS